MNGRRIALILGVLTFTAGTLAILQPGLLAFEIGRPAVYVIGILALLLAFRVLQASRKEERERPESEDPETPVHVPIPGDDFRSLLGRYFDTRQEYYYYPSRMRDALASAAADALTQFRSIGEQEAHELLARGEWTSDAQAAAFLGEDVSHTPTSFRERLRRLVWGGTNASNAFARAVDAIAGVAGVVVPDEPESTDWAPLENEQESERTREPERRSHDDREWTGHWTGVSMTALVAIGVGILAEQPAVLLAGTIGIGFAAYARSRAFPPGDVAIERHIDPPEPAPDEPVEVTVTLINESGRFLADLRVVDGVPDALAVEEGSPRFGTALRPGDRQSFRYTLTARRGVHEFGEATIEGRDLAGASAREQRVATDTEITCIPPLRPLTGSVPLRAHATEYVGQLATTSGGEGIEFFSTREYRRGDAPGRIDWNRRARTGELATIEFREERSATVYVVIDARHQSYVSPSGESPHAVDRAVDVAGRLVATLSGSGDRVGLTAVSTESCWLSAGAGEDHRTEARHLLSTHPALSSIPPADPVILVHWQRRFRRRVEKSSQVILLSPLVDEQSYRLARRLEAYGYPVTVISVDPTTTENPGHRFARVVRTMDITRLRGADIPVIDWSWEEDVDTALLRYEEARSE